MGRRLKSKIPTSATLLAPESNIQIQDNLKQRQDKQKAYFDRQTKLLSNVHIGDHVRMQRGDVWQPAVIIKEHEQPRSFIVQTQDGKTYRRNRKHLLKTREKCLATNNAVDDTDGEMDSHVTDTQSSTVDLGSQDVELSESQPQGYTTRSGRQIKMPSRYKD